MSHQRTEMLAGVSHDLKTPLTRMKLALAMMPDNADIARLQADIAEMEHMLDDYLAFARGEGGEEAEETDLGELVRDTATAAAKARAADDDRLTVAAPEHVRAQRQDGGAAPLPHQPGGQCAEGRPACRGRLCSAANAHAEIAVEDDGPGIPESRREEAFRPFHRLDQGRNLQSGGSGLGLAIARDIARAHGGDITLDKSALGGLKAAIRLPV